MEYLNLEAHVFRSPEFIGADPVQRGTWIALQGWCASQENGGRIVDCREWKDRMWQQLIGVTSAEILEPSPLWRWEGDDLIVIHYPIDQELALHAKRDACRAGGKATSQAKADAARENGSKGGRPPKPTAPGNPTETQAPTQAEPNVKEGNVMEGKGREDAPSAAEKPTLSPSKMLPVDRVKAELSAVFPDAPKHLTGQDQHDLFDSLRVLDEFTAEDWQASRAWIICPDRVRGLKLWPRTRSEFVKHAGDAIEKIRPWWKSGGGKSWWNRQESRPTPTLVVAPPPPADAEPPMSREEARALLGLPPEKDVA